MYECFSETTMDPVPVAGESLYQIPIDMFVDQIIIQDGWIILLNSNNLLLSVVLDFN